MNLHQLLKAGYRIHELAPTPVAAACAQLAGRKIPSLPVLRKD
jgi:hypothetical protein